MAAYSDHGFTLSNICHLNVVNGRDVRLSKKKQRRNTTQHDQPSYYYYSIVLKEEIWKKIIDNQQFVERVANQIRDKRVSAPQIIDLGADQWIIHLSIYNGILYYGIHVFDFNRKEILPGNGMNLTANEFKQFCDNLRHKRGQHDQIIINQTYFQWQWKSDGQIIAEDTWFPTESLCLQAALMKKPGDNWSLEINTKREEHEFCEAFLDVIFAELVRQKIKYLSNAVQYYLSDTSPSTEDIELYGDEAVNSVTKTDMLDLTLSILKKQIYISVAASSVIIKKIALYQKKHDILIQLKSGKLNPTFVDMICQ